jgi:hypothetical protein
MTLVSITGTVVEGQGLGLGLLVRRSGSPRAGVRAGALLVVALVVAVPVVVVVAVPPPRSGERRLFGQRMREALAVERVQGVRLGRPPALGQEPVDRIVTARATGMTLAGIAENLNSTGVPTARGGARWYASTVSAVLNSQPKQAVKSRATAGYDEHPREWPIPA